MGAKSFNPVTASSVLLCVLACPSVRLSLIHRLVFVCVSVIIVTMLTQKLLPGRAECPKDVLFPSDRGNPPGPQLPFDPHLMPAERCGGVNPGWKDDKLNKFTATRDVFIIIISFCELISGCLNSSYL